MLTDLISLIRALINDIRAELNKNELYYVRYTPSTIESKLRGNNKHDTN